MIIEIDGRRVEVDDGFLSLSPEDQNRTVDEIATQMALPPVQNIAQPASANAATGPESYEAPIDESFGRGLKVAAQGLGKGAADILGTPGDLVTGGINAASGVANELGIPALEAMLRYVEPSVDIPEIPYAPNPLGSDAISQRASNISEWLGYDVLDPETEMTPEQRLGYNVNRFGGQAGLEGAGLLRAATTKAPGVLPGVVERLVEPYRYAGKPGRMLAGDVAGGVGAGTGLHALDEYTSEDSYFGSQNPITRLLVMMAGGVTGSNVPGAASLPGRAKQAITSRMASDLPPDPITGERFINKDVDLASKFLKSRTTDAPKARADIAASQNFFRETGGAMPTSGQLSDDTGLQLLEKGISQRNAQPFAERNRLVADSASADVERLYPEGATREDMFRPREMAESGIAKLMAQIEQMIGGAQRNVEQAQASEAELGGQLAPMAGQRDVASEALDKTVVEDIMRPMQGQKNRLFENIDPNAEELISVEELINQAEEIRARASTLPPELRDEVLPLDVLRAVENMAPRYAEEVTDTGLMDERGVPIKRTKLVNEGGEGAMSFRGMNEMRPILSAAEYRARQGGHFPLADNIRAMKTTINEEADALAEQSSPAGMRAKEALDFFQKEFAPRFGQGEGKLLRESLNADDKARTRNPPTKTAGRFLKPGEGGKEKAADLKRILAGTKGEAAGKKAARDYIMADLADVVSDGKVNAQRLARWQNANQGLLSEFPDIAKEVKALEGEVKSRSLKVSTMRKELEAATKKGAQTQEEIDRSAIKLLTGRDPKNMVEAIFSSKDPAAAINEVKDFLKGHVSAERGFQAAVAKRMADKMSGVSAGSTSEGVDSLKLGKMLSFIKENEPALQAAFGDDMKYLNVAQRRLEALAKRGIQAGVGSPTIENVGLQSAIINPYDVAMRMWFGALKGGSETRKLKLFFQQFGDPAAKANELVKRSLLDPEIIKHLYDRPSKELLTPAWNKRLAQLMRWTEVAREFNDEDER